MTTPGHQLPHQHWRTAENILDHRDRCLRACTLEHGTPHDLGMLLEVIAHAVLALAPRQPGDTGGAADPKPPN